MEGARPVTCSISLGWLRRVSVFIITMIIMIIIIIVVVAAVILQMELPIDVR